MDLQRQLILTKDNITVNIDTVVYYRIVDAKKATYRVKMISASVCEITYATLRTICGEHTLQ
jgi:erythrocyte band 7 integral membrane protein